MSKKIKGITIEIDGDVSPLENALKDVDKVSKQTTSELGKINRALKFDNNNTVLLAQKQEVLQEAIQGTSKRLDGLRQAQSEVERMFQSGDIDGAAYRDFRRELEITEGKLGAYKRQLSTIETSQREFAEATSQLKTVLRESGTSIDMFSDALGEKLVNAIKEGRATTYQLKNAFEQIQRSITESKSGLTQYKTAMGELEADAKKLRQELQLKEQQLKNVGKQTELYEARVSGLQAQQRNLAQQVMATVMHLNKAKAEFGANSKEVKDLEDKLISLRIANEQVVGQLKDTQKAMQNAADAEQKLGSASKDLTNLFSATGKSIDDFTSLLGSDLVNAIKQGSANANQLEQAFNRISRTTLGANADLERLRATLRTLDSGGSLDDVRQDLEDIERQARQSEQQVNKLSDALGAMGAVVAGIGIKEVIDKAIDTSDVDAKINVTFDVPEESKKTIREAIVDVKKYGVDANEALEGIRIQWALNKNATDANNRAIVEGAASITKAYGDIDFKELVQETNEIASELGTTNDEALNIVNSLLKIGFPTSQIDIIAEYGGQLRRAGYEAQEVASILASASASKSWNIDNLLDGLKEGRIRAAEMGAGLSSGLQENLRKLFNTTKAATEEQLAAMEQGFDKQEQALTKSLSNREKQISKAHNRQQKNLDKALNNETKALDKALREQTKALEKAHDKKLKLLDAEYMAKLKVIDEERYNAIKAIEDEIKALEGLTEAEDKAEQARENAEKRATLVSKVENAKTRKNKELAIAELAKFDEEIRAKAVQEERKGRIDLLKEQKDDVKDSFDDKKESLKNEYDLKKDQLKEIQNAEKESLGEQQALQREALNERQQLNREALSERLSDEMDRVRESHAFELNSFKKMTKEKLELAKNPPDSAQYKAIESQLQAWGAAIAEGGEGSTKAFEEMTAWLNEIDNATLKNLIGTELFGTLWEDQGDKIVQALMGSEEAMEALQKQQQNVKKANEGLDDSNAVSLGEAFGKLNEALKPVYDALAKVIGVIADLMIRFPTLSAIIVGTVATLGILGGAVIALGPIVGGVTTFFGGLWGLIIKLSPILLNLGTKILPLLGRGIAMMMGPWGIAIAAIAGAVYLIIQNWEPIVDFFKGIWDGIVAIFTWALDFIKEHWKTLLAIVTGPLGLIVVAISKYGDQIKSFFSKMWKSVLEIFRSAGKWLSDATNSLFNYVMTPINRMRDGIINAFQFVKSSIMSIWSAIANIMKSPINYIIQMLNTFIRGVNKIKVPDWVPLVGGKGISIPEIPMLAKGTDYFKGGMAIVGERGPELVTMPSGAKVHPNDKTMDMLGGGININVAQLHVREEADVNKIARQLYSMYDKERRGR